MRERVQPVQIGFQGGGKKTALSRYSKTGAFFSATAAEEEIPKLVCFKFFFFFECDLTQYDPDYDRI